MCALQDCEPGLRLSAGFAHCNKMLRTGVNPDPPFTQEERLCAFWL